MLNNFEGVLTDIMIFMFIFYKEDVTPNSLNRSLKLGEKIIEANFKNEKIWIDLIEFTKNPYTTMSRLSKVLKILNRKLGASYSH